MIGDSVEVKVLGIRSGQVKIGVEAPKDMPVHREEIYNRIREEEGQVQPIQCGDAGE